MNDSNKKTYLKLTDMQKGILFESIHTQNDSSYIGQMILDWKRKLNLSLFKKTLKVLSDRHAIMRSAIQSDPEFNQIVHQSVQMPINLLDYSNQDVKTQNKKWHKLLYEDIHNGFDMLTPPLMRFSIVKFNDEHYKILWTRHHLIIDGASANKIINEFLMIYQSFLTGSTYQIESPSLYSNALNKIIFEQNKADKINWSAFLEGYEEAAISLPTSKHHKKKIKKKFIKCEIKDNKYIDLRNHIKNNQYSMNVILQAAWALVLYIYNNKEKCIFGNVRAYPDNVFNEAVGLFINTLPILINVSGNISVKKYLNDVKQQNTFLKENVYKSLQKIKNDLNLTSNNPLFETILDYKPFQLNATAKNKFKDFNLQLDLKLEVPYSIVIEATTNQESLEIKINYDSNMYQSYHIQSILKYYKKFIQLMLVDTNRSINELVQMVMSPHYKKIIYDFNNTERILPNKTIHRLFEEQVIKSPNSPALYYNGETISYLDLNKRANQLANYLIKRNVHRETVIGLYLKPNFDMIIAILAILKAGCSYTIIDITYPEQRIKYIVQDCSPLFVLSTSNLKLPLINQVVALLDKLDFSRFPDSKPNLDVDPNNLMYINYTSGSTGKPKGVAVEHHSAVNTSIACIEKFDLGATSRVLQIASPSFDVAVAEWTMTLISGGCLYLIAKDIFSPSEIIKALKDYKITTIILSSSILSSLPVVELPDLHVIAVGGETLSKSIIYNWGKNRKLYNVYGVTEATICTSVGNVSIDNQNLTVGKPLLNTKVYVLNNNLNPIPFYGKGEIYIGGNGVSRGYINNSVLTQEKFLINPFYKNSHLYKTGDLGRILPSGELEIIGRIDDQVKLKGIRIELSEIEQLLERFPGVKKAVVQINVNSGYKNLIGYIQLEHQPEKNDLLNIKQFLHQHLPSYMIPNELIEINNWPLTSNGKIDKATLASLKSSDFLGISQNDVYINNQIQEKIVVIVKQLLNKIISIQDNFIDMGMDSLRMVEFSLKLSKTFQKEISVTILFTYGTIEMLAEYIDKLMNNSCRLNENKDIIRPNFNKKFLNKKRIRFNDE